MSEVRRKEGGHVPRLWIIVLGACTLWLVIQNTVVMAAVLWTDPPTAARVVAALVKVSTLLIARFWSTPAAIAILAGILTGLALRAQPAPPARAEVRHG
jgi:hypothetical protein